VPGERSAARLRTDRQNRKERSVSVKLRLMRVGKKKQPTYRIVAADSRSPRDGRFIEIVGTYAPRSDPSEINVKSEKALAWLAKGAQPTETVRKILEISGVWGDFEATKSPKAQKRTPARSAAAASTAAPAEGA
jgi:small subunit ribosomal protein S16